MHDLGLGWNQQHMKCAKIVGETMGDYHPHGDAAIYDALVRMAQDCSMRVPLIDGQGNFGSIDGVPPAAMRYTEARLSPDRAELLADLDKDTVDFIANYDDRLPRAARPAEQVPQPARQRLRRHRRRHGDRTSRRTTSARSATRAIAPHRQPRDHRIDELMEIIPGPDFPTGGIICGRRASSTPTAPAAARS